MSTAEDKATSAEAGRVPAIPPGDAGSAAVGTVESVGGVKVPTMRAADCATPRKGCTLGANGGAGAGIKKTTRKARPQSGTTVSTIVPTALGTEDEIQGMVDTIKSRNPNHGGGRQAKGGPWTCEYFVAIRCISETHLHQKVGK